MSNKKKEEKKGDVFDVEIGSGDGSAFASPAKSGEDWALPTGGVKVTEHDGAEKPAVAGSDQFKGLSLLNFPVGAVSEILYSPVRDMSAAVRPSITPIGGEGVVDEEGNPVSAERGIMLRFRQDCMAGGQTEEQFFDMLQDFFEKEKHPRCR